VAPVLITSLLTLCATAVFIFRGPVGKALGRRLEGGSAPAGEELAARVTELEHRLADVEQERARVAELEERLDFAERLLVPPARGAGQIAAGGEAP
jgi:hypothetical protein